MKGINNLLVTIFLISSFISAQTITFDDSDSDIMVIDNGSTYEIGLLKKNGSLSYIKDLFVGIRLTNERGIWLIGDRDNNGINSEFYEFNGANTFNYSWDNDSKILTMNYIADTNEPKKVTVTVTISFYADSYFDMQMELFSQWEPAIKTVSFPTSIPINLGAGDEVLLPIAYPGMLLESNSFIQQENHEYGYPGVFQADYISIYISGGKICFYTLRDGLEIQPNTTGIHYSGQPSTNYYITHDYETWIQPGSTWISPISRCYIGKSHVETLKSYRNDNKIDEFPSLQSKLDNKFEQVSKSLLYYYPFTQNPPLSTFQNFPDFASTYPNPGIVLLSMYYTGGYHGHHPDYLPPDPQSGTTEDFIKMVDDIQEQGKLAMAFVQPVWWHENSPTIQSLGVSNISEVAQINMEGNPVYEGLFSSWLDDPWDYGYFVSPSSPLVQQQFDQIHTDIFETYGCDMTYEDVLGAPWGGTYDFNSNATSPANYYNEWFELAKRNGHNLLSAEGAYDRMAEYIFGSMTTNYESNASDESEWGYKPGEGTWRPYPSGTILYNDKMINYHYWTPAAKNKDIIGWDIFFSCPLNMIMSAYDGGQHAWINTAHIFQVHVVSRISVSK